MSRNTLITDDFSPHTLHPGSRGSLTDGSCGLFSQRAQDPEGFAWRRRLRGVSAKNGL